MKHLFIETDSHNNQCIVILFIQHNGKWAYNKLNLMLRNSFKHMIFMSTLIKPIPLDFSVHNSESHSWIIYRVAVLITNPVLFWTPAEPGDQNNSLITSYSWLTINMCCFGCVLGIHIRTTHPVWLLWSGVSRGDCGRRRKIKTLPQWQSLTKAASLESDRREGNRIRGILTDWDCNTGACMCYSHYQLSQSVVLQVILNTIPIIQSALSIISTSLSQLRWTENWSLMESEKGRCSDGDFSFSAFHQMKLLHWQWTSLVLSSVVIFKPSCFFSTRCFLFVLTLKRNLRYHLFWRNLGLKE